MKIGVKYCGGCNPIYDRLKFVNRVINKYQDILSIETALKETIYDVILIVCGCKSCCADQRNLNAKYLKILINNQNDYQNVCYILEEVIKTIN